MTMVTVCDYCQRLVRENYDAEVAICTECGAIEGDTTEMTEEEWEELL